MCVKTTDGDIYRYDVEQVADVVANEGEIGGYPYVDLGLPSGTKWATYNVGADSETGADIPRITTDETAVLVENATAGAQIVLLNASGVTVAATTACEAGTATISLPSAKGVYVLKVGRQSFKLIR